MEEWEKGPETVHHVMDVQDVGHYYVVVRVKDRQVPALIDTGSRFNLVTSRIISWLRNYPILETRVKLSAASGES